MSRIAMVTGANQGSASLSPRVNAIAGRHGGVDIVFSNAAARLTPGTSWAEQVRPFVTPTTSARRDCCAHSVPSFAKAKRAADEGWPEWINVPSKVGQVAAVRVVARERRSTDVAAGTLVAAICPGLVDTDASRPWFEEMDGAQTPTEAAVAPLRLALERTVEPAFYGELVQFGNVIPWR